jgi:hypothetical protein
LFSNELVGRSASRRAAPISIDEATSKKLPLTAYFDNRFVNELEKEGFFKKLW